MADLTRLVEARRLAAQMLVEFTKSVDAGNRAVMADTDDASATYAREATEALAATAVTAVREIQVLQAPHIAESDDAAMTRIEKTAADAEAVARRSLEALASLIGPGGKPRIALATAALDRFMALNREVETLSRRNSNVRSLALSLGQKRTLSAACDDSLRELQNALAARTFAGTRYRHRPPAPTTAISRLLG